MESFKDVPDSSLPLLLDSSTSVKVVRALLLSSIITPWVIATPLSHPSLATALDCPLFAVEPWGHHLDLRPVWNQWLLIDPGAECLMSEANEYKTTEDTREMGGRLAEEVTAFLRKKMDEASKSGGYRNVKLSFVGHSIGNIIIRSALAEDIGVLQEHNFNILTTGWLCSLSFS